MTRTQKTGTMVRGGRAVVVGGMGLAALVLAAAPAFAKGSVDISAPHTAHVGRTFTVTAHGDDDAASYLRVCLEDRRAGSAWHRVSCGAVAASGTDARSAAHIRTAHGGVLQFRAVVYGLTTPHDRHPVRERTSGPVRVNVH
ncbi:hypothetical protein ACEZDB_13110 [Streptacidiphilus sp. N1-3]|uniref:Secreted protein n=1 Tax=Streptacidiphilus alkalitolerans TaxID=3342712 RepID=A0ABV6WZX7_9ACTN